MHIISWTIVGGSLLPLFPVVLHSLSVNAELYKHKSRNGMSSLCTGLKPQLLAVTQGPAWPDTCPALWSHYIPPCKRHSDVSSRTLWPLHLPSCSPNSFSVLITSSSSILISVCFSELHILWKSFTIHQLFFIRFLCWFLLFSTLHISVQDWVLILSCFVKCAFPQYVMASTCHLHHVPPVRPVVTSD